MIAPPLLAVSRPFGVRGAIRWVDGAVAAPHVLVQGGTSIEEQQEDNIMTSWPSIVEIPHASDWGTPNSPRGSHSHVNFYATCTGQYAVPR